MDPTPPLATVQDFDGVPPISAGQFFRVVAARPMARKDITQTLAHWGVVRFERCDAAIDHFVGRCRSGMLPGALVLARKR